MNRLAEALKRRVERRVAIQMPFEQIRVPSAERFAQIERILEQDGHLSRPRDGVLDAEGATLLQRRRFPRQLLLRGVVGDRLTNVRLDQIVLIGYGDSVEILFDRLRQLVEWYRLRQQACLIDT